MADSQPPDTEQVRYAFRLGWVVVELRGRYRPDRFGEREPGNQGVFLRKDFELPLSNERSPAEIRIELFDAAEDLSRELKLAPCDEDGHPLLGQVKSLLQEMEAENADREPRPKSPRSCRTSASGCSKSVCAKLPTYAPSGSKQAPVRTEKPAWGEAGLSRTCRGMRQVRVTIASAPAP